MLEGHIVTWGPFDAVLWIWLEQSLTSYCLFTIEVIFVIWKVISGHFQTISSLFQLLEKASLDDLQNKRRNILLISIENSKYDQASLNGMYLRLKDELWLIFNPICADSYTTIVWNFRIKTAKTAEVGDNFHFSYWGRRQILLCVREGAKGVGRSVKGVWR